ncbi:MAG: PAS domain S-box protein, partial [Proteobacteria bacterium]|nr:PAS domain S-box protein [Pseudomonadota bacterium]
MNARCATLYHCEPAACLGKTDFDLAPSAAPVFQATDRATLERGEAMVHEQQVEIDGETRHYLAHKFPIRDGRGRIVSIAGTSIDITELKRAEERLREAEMRMRTIVQDMPVLMDAFDADGTIVAWNRECERVTGYAAAEIVGNPDAMRLLYPDPAYLEAMLSEAQELRQQSYSRVFELTAKDGSRRSVEWFNLGAKIAVPGWLEWSIGIDVTERRRLEAALHEATVREQRRLGHDLHDGLGQELTGLSLLAQSLAHRHALDPALAAELAELAQLAAQAIVTCKNVARGLAPVEEARKGLAEALRQLAGAFPHAGAAVAIECRIRQSAPLAIPLEASNHLYRIAQEALTNAVRHARARAISLELDVDRDHVRLTVRDDGEGFDPGAAPGAGMGLTTMRTRARAIGARLSVGGGPPGTVVSCERANRANVPQRRSRE